MKFKISGLMFLMLVFGTSFAQEHHDCPYLLGVSMSNAAERITSSIYEPLNNVNSFSDKDKTIFYSADIGIINPAKKKYRFKIVCIDRKGKVIFKGLLNRSDFIKDKIGVDKIIRLTQQLELKTAPGAMAYGQTVPLESGQDYFVKLYVDKKLIAVTKFSYSINKGI